MIRAVQAELFKLGSVRFPLVMLLSALGLVMLTVGSVLFIVTAGIEGLRADESFQDVATPSGIAALVASAGSTGLFALILGATAIPGEHRWATITATLLAEPRRTRVLLAKVAAHFVVGVGFGAAGVVAALGFAGVWLTVEGTGLALGTPVLATVLLLPLATGLSGALGVGIGAVLRSQVGAVVSVLVWVLVIEPIVGGVLDWTFRWLPIAGAAAAISVPDGPPLYLPSWQGALLLSGYVAVAAAAGGAALARRDVT